MKRLQIINILLSIILPTAAYSAPTDWDKEYRELCSYDTKFCPRVKNTDGTFAKPKKEIVALLKELAPAIQSSAKTLGIDPRAIAGAIMAENSLNVGISDSVQNLLVKIGVANKGEILGKKFSYGLGQLNFAPARKAEDYMAAIEKRKPLTDQELQEAILTPDKSVYLVGAVIRKAQDDYKNQGIDISNRPEILATLYNLGGSEAKAIESKKSGSLPRPNFFGFFVNKYIDDLAFLKAAVKKEVPVVAAAKNIIPSAPTKVVAALSQATSPVVAVAKKLSFAFNKSMPLYSSPPTCKIGNEAGSTNIQEKYNSMKSFSVTAIAEKESTFTSMIPTIDCETNTWLLIKLSTGEVGWIKKDDLEKNTSKIMVSSNNCKPQVDNKCLDRINDQLKDFSLTNKSNMRGNEVFARPYSKSNKTSFTTPDWACADKATQEDIKKGTNLQMQMPKGSGYGSPPGSTGQNPYAAGPSFSVGKKKNNLEELNTMLDQMTAKEKEIEAKYQRPLTDAENPFYSVNFPLFKKNINDCVNKQKYNLRPCPIDSKVFNELLKSIPLKDHLSQDDKDELTANFMIVANGAERLYTNKEFKDLRESMGAGFMMSLRFSSIKNTDEQYLPKEGDSEKWQVEDIKSAFKECSISLDTIKAKVENSSKFNLLEKTKMTSFLENIKTFSMKPAADTLDEILKQDEDTKKANWPKVQPSFISLAKMCLSLDDLFQLNKPNAQYSKNSENFLCYFQGLNVLESKNELVLKDLLRETLFNPEGFQDLATRYQLVFGTYSPTALGLTGMKPAQASNLMMTIFEMPTETASYCPNKTAETIEEIVKNNPCIQRVYVPDKWLINRLNELGNKVVFRPFPDDDRYSFDLEKTQCN